AVGVQNWQNCATLPGIEEFRTMPRRCRRSRFRLPIAHDARNDQLGIVERCTEGCRQGIAELASLVNCAGNAGIKMTRETARPRKGSDKFMQTGGVKGQCGIEVVKCAFKIKIREIGRRAVTRTGDQHYVEILAKDELIQMSVNKINSGTGSPMAKQPVFDMFRPKRLSQQHIVL